MWTVVLEAVFIKSPYACRKVIARIEAPLNGMIPWLSLVLSIRHRERQSLIDDDCRPEWTVKSSCGKRAACKREDGLTYQ